MARSITLAIALLLACDATTDGQDDGAGFAPADGGDGECDVLDYSGLECSDEWNIPSRSTTTTHVMHQCGEDRSDIDAFVDCIADTVDDETQQLDLIDCARDPGLNFPGECSWCRDYDRQEQYTERCG